MDDILRASKIIADILAENKKEHHLINVGVASAIEEYLIMNEITVRKMIVGG